MISAMPELHLPLPKISDECHTGFLVVFYSDSSLNRTVCLFVCLYDSSVETSKQCSTGT